MLKCFWDTKQLIGINKLFLKNFVNCSRMTGQLVCKPYIATSLVPQLLPNYFSYVQLVEFFHKKSVCRSFYYLRKVSPNTLHTNKYETTHALTRDLRNLLSCAKKWRFYRKENKSVSSNMLFQIFLFLVFVLRLYFANILEFWENVK